jgi:hypothetical protein
MVPAIVRNAARDQSESMLAIVGIRKDRDNEEMRDAPMAKRGTRKRAQFMIYDAWIIMNGGIKDFALPQL